MDECICIEADKPVDVSLISPKLCISDIVCIAATSIVIILNQMHKRKYLVTLCLLSQTKQCILRTVPKSD